MSKHLSLSKSVLRLPLPRVGCLAFLLAAATVPGCGPNGDLYPNRVPVAVVELDCDEASSSCEQIEILSVNFGGSGSEIFVLGNEGWASLEYELVLVGTDEAVAHFKLTALAWTPISPGKSVEVTLTYTPTDYEDREVDLKVNVVGADGVFTPISIPIHASTSRDGDRDGHEAIAVGGDDCDDNDALVNPGALEVWYDGVDQDCDGNDCDQDGDGVPSTSRLCVDPDHVDCDDDGDGYDVYAKSYGCRGGDCDDSDPALHVGC